MRSHHRAHESARQFEHAAAQLVGLAGVAEREGRGAEAVRLLGVVDASWRARGMPLWPIDDWYFKLLLARVQAQLDQATFVAAWDIGHTAAWNQRVVGAWTPQAQRSGAALIELADICASHRTAPTLWFERAAGFVLP